MADEELSLKESLYNILNGLQSEKNWRETGEGLSRLRDVIPNVTESLARGGVAQAVGTMGDFRDLRNTINSYLPKSVSNFTRAAEFLSNPYANVIQETAPTTESTKEFVPRVTETYPGYEQHETLGEYIAPSLGYFAGKGAKALKDLPAGMSIMGPESKLWKPEMAFQASKMEAKGVPADEILQKTGMVRGLDNQWRSEISDINSALKGEGDTFGTRHGNVHPSNNRFTTPERRAEGVLVEDILHHPELLEAYPELGKIKVEAHGSTRGEKGAYRQSKNTISIREDLTPEEAKSTLLHELTHGIQAKEQFNRGANYKEQVAKFFQQKQAIIPEIEALNKEASIALNAGDKDKYHILMAQRDNLSQKYLAMNPEEMGYDAYRHHAGEAEARMVQERAGLTEDKLREIYPYQQGKNALDINPDEAIVTTRHPSSINMPEQSIDAPKASVEVKGIPQSEVDELGFHSPLEAAILKIGQPKGTGDQFLKQLEKMPGVKTEELEVSGVKKYLQDHPTVTKQELQDYIAKNRVTLENTVLGKATDDGYGDYQLHGGDVYHDQDYIDSLADDLHHDLMNDPDIYQSEKEALLENNPDLYEGNDARLNDDVDEALRERALQQSHDMYYDNPITHHYDDYGYDIYGNDDNGYTFKDPNGRFLDIGSRRGVYDIGEAEDVLRGHLLDEGVIDIGGDGVKYEDYTLPGKYQNYREILTTIPENIAGDVRGSKRFNELSKKISSQTSTIEEGKEFGKLVDQGKAEDYTSGHYDEPNILAHMRVNDRMINGKNTLMVEEIQSDWHQAGRKNGYKNADSYKRMDEITKEQGLLHREKMKLREERKGQIDDEQVYDELSKKINDIENQQRELQLELNNLGNVPDAPFKKNWHEMMVKQALKTAVEEGYDAVAFTTGRQQVERYENSLRKTVDEINFNKRDDNTISINAMKDGRETFAGIVQDGKFIDGPGKGKTVEEVLGKGIAKQVAEGELLKPGTIRGKDLTIGGEGMKGFYDKIIPDFINKYGKKWGMGMKKSNLDAYGQGLSTHQVEEGIKNLGYTMDEYQSKTPSEKMEIFNKIAGEEVHFVELTDAAKKDIKEKGQPLFSGIGLAAPALMPDDQDKRKK